MSLVARQITKSFGDRTVLHPTDLIIGVGERHAIIGETGSGKTTLLRCLAGLMDLSGGELKYRDSRVEGPSETLLPGHPRISYLHQSVDLRNHYRVKDLLERHSTQDLEKDWELAKACRIEELMDRMTDQLSGGERQRIALAIELSKGPAVLLLDEPFSNLDIGHRNTLREVLEDLHAKKDLSIVIVSHNPAEILGWADQMHVMRKGACLQSGKPDDIYHAPSNEYTAGLLGPYNMIALMPGKPRQLIRPERMRLVSIDQSSLHGRIMKAEFEGHSYLYTIKTAEDENLQVRENGRRAIGEYVGIFVVANLHP